MTRVLKGMVVQILKAHSLEYSRVGNAWGAPPLATPP